MRRPCPVCAEEGDSFRGTPPAELRHFLARAVWAMHRMRLAADALRATELSGQLSECIRLLERVGEEMLGGRLH